jgi:HIV Tat-specific factor 1
MAPEDRDNAINKNSRVVVLKYMFTLKELAEDTSLLLDLKEDVREECSTLGEVTNVVLYDVSQLMFSIFSCLTVCRPNRMV